MAENDALAPTLETETGIPGVDVSHWQGDMAWEVSYAAGIRAAMVRAGSINNDTGTCYSDWKWSKNMATRHPLIRYGAYWFFRPNWSAVKQADFFCGLILTLARPLDLPPACDIEVGGDASAAETFCRLVKQRIGECAIYTNAATFGYTQGGKVYKGTLKGDVSWAKAYPLWVADWTPPVLVPYPWTTYYMHQYGIETGPPYGAEKPKIDVDRVSSDWWSKRFAPTPPPPAPTHDEKVEIMWDWGEKNGYW